MKLTTATLIGSKAFAGTGARIYAYQPETNQALEPAFPDSSLEQVDQACRLAEEAFDGFRAAPLSARAALLEAIAEEILAIGDALLERTQAETGLTRARLEGERGRTVGQLRMFSTLVREGRFLDIAIDSALPERKPVPRPDLRLRKIPLGPAAIFGASNFPYAFSVAGGDTASALAAGCPAVVKAHPAHPGTSEMIGLAVQKAVKDSGLPEGVFSMLHGHQTAIGEALVKHPSIAVVAFTGSRHGGIALAEIAARRLVPIPVYAEMSSVNPVFLLPHALEARGTAIAHAFVDSLTLGTGQFCTQPGLVFGIDGPALRSFLETSAQKLIAKDSTLMLTPGIFQNYREGVEKMLTDSALSPVAQGQESTKGLTGRPALFRAQLDDFLKHLHLGKELFGPSSVAVICKNEQDLLQLAKSLEGQLTATIQMDREDMQLAGKLLPVLERKAGRILANGFPTGVEVSYAMVHGGPFPATTDSRSTSVGATAVDRFLRPVCYQDLPEELLAPELQSGNPLHLPRLVDGKSTSR